MLRLLKNKLLSSDVICRDQKTVQQKIDEIHSPKLLYDGNAAIGSTITMPAETLNYKVFAVQSAAFGVIQLGAKSGFKWDGTGNVSCCGSYDTGSATYEMRTVFEPGSTGLKWYVKSASHHLISASGCAGSTTSVKRIWGII